MRTNNEEVIELVTLLQQWHENKTGQMRKIIEHKDADIHINDITIAADSEIAKGLRFGIGMSLELIGKLPFSVSLNEVEGGTEDGH